MSLLRATHNVAPLAAACLLAFGVPSLLAAQDRPIVGVVSDTAGASISGVRVELVGSLRFVMTGRDGRFAIRATDSSSLSFRKLGYHPMQIDLAPALGTAVAPLRVVLSAHPVELLGVAVPAERSMPMGYAIMRESVRRVPPLAEPDIIRVLPFVAGVQQPNDLIGAVHLAGAAGDETSMTLDDHPLQFPTHLGGIFGAFNVAALERADVFMHHVSALSDSRLGGLIALRTRQSEPEPVREGVLGLLSSSVTVSQPVFRGINVLATGRLTYMDRLLAVIYDSARFGDEDLWAPTYRDGLLRIDASLPADVSAELLLYGTEDTPASVGKSYSPPLYEWGETLAGLTLSRHSPLGRLSLRMSRDRAYAHDRTATASGLDRMALSQRWTSSSLTWTRTFAAWRLAMQLAYDARRNSHDLEPRDTYLNPTPAREVSDKTQQLAAAGAELSYAFQDDLTATAGARLYRLGSSNWAAPRFSVAWQPQSSVSIELAADRRLQFDAQPTPPEPGLMTQPVWLLDEPRRSEMIAGSVEWRRQRPAGMSLSWRSTLFARRFPDRLMDSIPSNRVRGRSVGLASSATFSSNRGNVTQMSYTYSAAHQRIAGGWYPTVWDSPHTLTFFSSTPVGRGFELVTAFQGHSGIATTPITLVLPASRGTNQELIVPRLRFGELNTARLGSYQRLDLGVRRSWRMRSAEWTGTFQVINALLRENPLEIDWMNEIQRMAQGGESRPTRAGLPMIPTVGLEVRW